jgi:glycosyltransferase involved in cell wall biosynthesis
MMHKSLPKILILGTQLEPGGAQKLIAWQVQFLSKKFDVRVKFQYFRFGFMGMDVESCVSSKSSRSPSNLIKIFAHLAKELKADQIVIAHTHYSIAMAAAIKILLQRSFKLIAVHHSESTLYPKWILWMLQLKSVLNAIDENVFVAEHIAFGQNFTIIPNPILKTARPKLPVGVQSKVDLLYVGRLSKEKGVETLIRAVGKARERKLLVIGDGAELPGLIELSKDVGASNSVTFLGALSPQYVQAYMNRCASLVIPSKSEALPMVLLEGIQQGCHIICTSIPAHDFAVEGGFAQSFKVGDHEMLAKILEEANINFRHAGKHAGELLLKYEEYSVGQQWLHLIGKLSIKGGGKW